MLKKIILFLIVVAGIAVIAAAQDACCERTVDGEWCQFTNANNCDENYRNTPVSCEQTSFCKVGCCYNSEEGQCFKSTPRSLCESDPKNTWNLDAACQIEQCSKGCCIIAGETFFVTEARCKAETSKYEDVEMDFREDVTTESACVALSRTQEKGCCVNGDSCSFTAREQCETSGAEAAGKDGFYLGTLCSNDALSCDCARQQRTGCLPDKDDVYWFDSCGNPENIYDSNKGRSYNQGYVLSEGESCSINGHDDPNCGNCEYEQGTLCAEAGDARPKFGDFVCGNLQCEANEDYSKCPSDCTQSNENKFDELNKPEMIDEIKSRGMTAYLVSNGTVPDMTERLLNHQPTNLYISVYGTTPEMYKKTAVPMTKGFWENVQQTLSMIKDFSCNTVFRLTLTKGLNFTDPEGYAKLIESAMPKFVEVKAFMAVGGSRRVLQYTDMPLHSEIQDFARDIEKHSSYKIINEKTDSRVVLLERR